MVKRLGLSWEDKCLVFAPELLAEYEFAVNSEQIFWERWEMSSWNSVGMCIARTLQTLEAALANKFYLLALLNRV